MPIPAPRLPQPQLPFRLVREKWSGWSGDREITVEDGQGFTFELLVPAGSADFVADDSATWEPYVVGWKWPSAAHGPGCPCPGCQVPYGWSRARGAIFYKRQVAAANGWPNLYDDEKEEPIVITPEPRQMPVIGYRGFYTRIEGKGKNRKAVLIPRNPTLPAWNPDGPTKAECACGVMGGALSTVKHDRSPDPNGSCGLYVLASLKTAPSWFPDVNAVNSKFGEIVIAGVMGWGLVAQHDDEGWRAEFAIPVAFLDTALYEDNEAIELLAKQYGAPVLTRKHLVNYVRELGDRLPGQDGKGV